MKIEYSHYFSFHKLKDTILELPARKFTSGSDRFTKEQLRKLSDDEIENIALRFKTLSYKPRRFQFFSSKLRFNKTSANGEVTFKYRLMVNPSNYDYPIFTQVKEYLKAVFVKKQGNFPKKANKVIESLNEHLKTLEPANNLFLIYSDFDSFFPNIDQKILLQMLEDEYKVDNTVLVFIKKTLEVYRDSFSKMSHMEVKGLLTTEEIDLDEAYNRFDVKLDLEKGIPQGLPISNILAEMYLANLDKELSKISPIKGKCFRYVDDLLLVIKGDEAKISKRVSKFDYKGIKLNSAKTIFRKTTDLGEKEKTKNEKFLGFKIIIGRDGRLRLDVANDAVANYINRIEYEFSKFEQQIKKKPNNHNKEELKKNNIIPLIKFRVKINFLLTGHIDKKDKWHHYGWLGYYGNYVSKENLLLIDNMVERFRNRSKFLRRVKFKRITNANTILNKKNTDIFYIPNIEKIKQYKTSLIEFLYSDALLRYEELEKLNIEQLREYVDDIIYEKYENLKEKVFDVNRGSVLYDRL